MHHKNEIEFCFLYVQRQTLKQKPLRLLIEKNVWLRSQILFFQNFMSNNLID